MKLLHFSWQKPNKANYAAIYLLVTEQQREIKLNNTASLAEKEQVVKKGA